MDPQLHGKRDGPGENRNKRDIFHVSVRIYVEAHGCTQNYGEARLMQQALAGKGHAITTSETDADAHVLVTCTVIETTERAMVRRMMELAAHNKPLVVAGCMAGAQRERVQAT